MALKVIYTQDYGHMSRVGAAINIQDMHQRTIIEKQFFNYGLATGISPVNKYALEARNQHLFDATLIRTWNLDEYVGLPGSTPEERAAHPESYAYFMRHNLFDLLHPGFAESHFPPATWIDQTKLIDAINSTPNLIYEGSGNGRAIIIPDDCANPLLNMIRQEMNTYTESIIKSGGIDTWVVGVGGMGHIGFHESGIPLDHDILLVKLDDNTIQNAVSDGHFRAYDEAPKYAISMGAAGIYRLSKKIHLLASGQRKTLPVAKSLLEDISSEVPISILQLAIDSDKEVTYIIDTPAAAGLIGKESILKNKGIIVEDHR